MSLFNLSVASAIRAAPIGEALLRRARTRSALTNHRALIAENSDGTPKEEKQGNLSLTFGVVRKKASLVSRAIIKNQRSGYHTIHRGVPERP